MSWLTMKERRAIPPIPAEFLRALTDEEIAKPACRWGHRWARVDGVNERSAGCRHFQCRKCFDRMATQTHSGVYTVPRLHWLNGGAWEDPTIYDMPTMRGPQSVMTLLEQSVNENGIG